MSAALVGASARKFLVIDDNVENRFLLTRTIRRKYPQATVDECGEIDLAARLARQGELDLVVSHRAGEIDGIELVRELRQANPTVPIVMVSGFDRTRAALEAGATRFLNYDEWLRLGTVIDEIFATQPWSALLAGLTYAIRTRTIVSFVYLSDTDATHHEVAPHLLGETPAREFVLRAHAASRSQPCSGFGWETYLLARIKDFALTDRSFAPQDAEPTSDRRIARVLCQV